MGINGTTLRGDECGITLGGTLLGSTRPFFERLLDDLPIDARLRLQAKTIKVVDTVSALGNNKFYFPTAFGSDLAIVSVNGSTFTPGKHYELRGNEVTWKFTGISIDPTDEIVGWGPINEHTAQAITIELVDTSLPAQFDLDGGGPSAVPKIYLQSLGDDLPFNDISIYLVINKSVYSSLAGDFTYDQPNERLIWNIQSDIELDGTEEIFMFWFNKVDTEPYILGQNLVRLDLPVTILQQEDFQLAAIPEFKQMKASLLYYGNIKYTYTKDYILVPPKVLMKTIGSGTLQPLLDPTSIPPENLDLSYIKSADAFISIVMFSQVFNPQSNGNPLLASTTMNLPSADPLPQTNTKGMLFFRGILGTYKYFDDNTEIGVTANFATTGQRYDRSPASSQVTWYHKPNLEGSPNTPAVVPKTTDVLEYIGFLDALSQGKVKVEYFIRNDANEYKGETGPAVSGHFETAEDIALGKCIVWQNGQAKSSLFSHFSVANGNEVTMSDSPPPAGKFDEIVIMYFNDVAVASLWVFNTQVLGTNLVDGGILDIGSVVTLPKASFLFANGEKVPSTDYIVNPADDTQLIIERVNPPSYPGGGDVLFAGDKILFVHL